MAKRKFLRLDQMFSTAAAEVEPNASHNLLSRPPSASVTVEPEELTWIPAVLPAAPLPARRMSGFARV